MNPKTVRLNITLPSDLVKKMDSYVGPRKKSQYITRAIRRQIEQDQKQDLEKAIEEGYRRTHSESVTLSREFEAADLEGWDDY